MIDECRRECLALAVVGDSLLERHRRPVATGEPPRRALLPAFVKGAELALRAILKSAAPKEPLNKAASCNAIRTMRILS